LASGVADKRREFDTLLDNAGSDDPAMHAPAGDASEPPAANRDPSSRICLRRRNRTGIARGDKGHALEEKKWRE